MDPINLLIAQHREARALIRRIDAARGEERHTLLARLAHDLFLHMRLEEDVFYRAVRRGENEEQLHEFYDEHAGMKGLLVQLAGLAPDSREFAAKLVVLTAGFDAHVAEEQSDLFPRALELLDEDEQRALAADLQARLNELEQPDALPTFDSASP
jgi:hypothetical protein